MPSIIYPSFSGESENDAMAVAEQWGGTNIMWASFWFIFALVCSVIGLLFAFDGITYKKHERIQSASIDGKEHLPTDSKIDPEIGASTSCPPEINTYKAPPSVEDYQLKNPNNDSTQMPGVESGEQVATKKKFWKWRKQQSSK